MTEELKFCKDCKHYEHDEFIGFHTCKSPDTQFKTGELNLVSGYDNRKLSSPRCSSEREKTSVIGYCGRDARYFEQSNPVPVPVKWYKFWR